MRRWLSILGLLALLLPLAACGGEEIGATDTPETQEPAATSAPTSAERWLDTLDLGETGLGPGQVRLTVGGDTLMLTLLDNDAARDLLSRLPLTLTFTDYASAEKIAYPPGEPLATEGISTGYAPEAGDLCLYAPWGNLCLFYRESAYAAGLVPLGRMEDGGAELLARQEGDFSLTLEAVD